MEVDSEELERLEHNLARKVEERARQNIFRYYAVLGTTIAALIGFFGYNVKTSIYQFAKNQATLAVSGAEQAARDAATKAGNQASAINERLKIINEHLSRREKALLEVEAETRRRKGAADQLENDAQRINSEADKLHKEVRTKSESATLQIEKIRSRVETVKIELNQEIAAQTVALKERNEAQITPELQRVNALAEGLEQLAQQVNELGQIVRQLSKANNIDELAEGQYNAEAVEQVANIAKKQQTAIEAVSRDETKSIVYVQFAGVARNVIESLSSELRKIGYGIPGEERLGIASGQHEVRFFHKVDHDRAKNLADRVSRVLENTGYLGNVTAEDFTAYKERKPPAGAMELWLEPVPAG